MNKIETLLLHKIKLKRLDGYEEASICICRISKGCDISELSLEFLSCQEKNELISRKYKRRKYNFLLSRFSGKKAILELLAEGKGSDITICNGVFGQPYIKEGCKNNFGLTLSHSDEYGVAIAYFNNICIGVDIQKIIKRNEDVIKDMLSEEEKEKLNKINIEENEKYTVIWSVKEAISKCLMTGFNTTVNIFSIEDIFRYDNYFKGNFRYFKQYKFISIKKKNFYLSIVYPSGMELVLDTY